MDFWYFVTHRRCFGSGHLVTVAYMDVGMIGNIDIESLHRDTIERCFGIQIAKCVALFITKAECISLT